MNGFVCFFQITDGSPFSMLVQAKDEQAAKSLVKGLVENEYGDDAGEIMAYNSEELRRLADTLEREGCEFDLPKSEVAA